MNIYIILHLLSDHKAKELLRKTLGFLSSLIELLLSFDIYCPAYFVRIKGLQFAHFCRSSGYERVVSTKIRSNYDHQ